MRAGLKTVGHVALDGSKVQANASKHKAMSYGGMKDEEKRLAAEIEALLRRAATSCPRSCSGASQNLSARMARKPLARREAVDRARNCMSLAVLACSRTHAEVCALSFHPRKRTM